MKLSISLLSAVLFGVAQAGEHNFFILGGISTLARGRVDPLVAPGKVSAHLHQIYGGGLIGLQPPTTAAMQQSPCTTVPIPEGEPLLGLLLHFKC